MEICIDFRPEVWYINRYFNYAIYERKVYILFDIRNCAKEGSLLGLSYQEEEITKNFILKFVL